MYVMYVRNVNIVYPFSLFFIKFREKKEREREVTYVHNVHTYMIYERL